MILSSFACLWTYKVVRELACSTPEADPSRTNVDDPTMSNALIQFFLRRRHKLTSTWEENAPSIGAQSRGEVVRVDNDELKGAASTQNGRTEGMNSTGLAPSAFNQLSEEIEKQRQLLQREFDLQRYPFFDHWVSSRRWVHRNKNSFSLTPKYRHV